MKRIYKILGVILMLLSITTCKKDADLHYTNIKAIEFSQKDYQCFFGETNYRLTPIFTPRDADNRRVTYSVEGDAVNIDSDGYITTKSIGEATITVTAINGLTAQCKVVVKEVEAYSISLRETSYSMRIGDTLLLSPSISPKNTTNKNVSYSVEGTAVSISENGVISADSVGTATIIVTTNNGKTARCEVIVKQIPDGFVDLGLSSGLLWATCNLGATSPEGYGNYFAWGETSTKSDYSSNTSTTYGKSLATLKSSGIVDANGNLTANYDVAQKFGKGRMPTLTEIKDLKEKCIWAWTSLNGVNGYRVTGPNGNSIFLPAAGYRNGSSSDNVGSSGNYWSSSAYDDSNYAYRLFFDSGDCGWHERVRYCGRAVRPVQGGQESSNTIEVTSITLSSTTVNLHVGETFTLTATVLPENATNKSVTYSSSNTAVAMVSSSGNITAVGAGTATITAATSNGKTASCVVTVTVPIIEVSSITLSETDHTMDVGETFTLTATVLPENVTNKSVTYSSSNTAVATVSSTGVVTARGVGDATITVNSSNGKKAQCKVVVKVEVTSISLNESNHTMDVGETFTLTATVLPENATNKSVTYSSSNTAVAMVSNNGVITAKSAGAATITATTSNGKTASCMVTVKMIEVISVALGSTSYSMIVNEKITLTPTIFPENATDRTITYSVNNSVVSVSENGVVTANGVGVAIVTATTSNGIMAQCEIIVTPIEATSISLSQRNVSIIEGRSFTLKATVLPSNAIDKSITYSVSGPEISVSSSGVVTTNQVGKATIIVTASNGVSAQCEVTVLKIPDGFVDLGLSVFWATCNLGASSPEEYGDYYAWGETELKTEYIVENSKRYGVSESDLKKQGLIDVYGNLTANYDVAQKLGKGRMPTLTEIKELKEKCTWTWITQNGVKGYKVTSKTNGNSIFLPAAGYRYGSSSSSIGSYGRYWSSTAYDDSSSAYYLYFRSSNYGWNYFSRYYGQSVRPVTE